MISQTESWLQGKTSVPEIADKCVNGPIVEVALSAPDSVAPGEPIPLRAVLASNKVGHDFPTGRVESTPLAHFWQQWDGSAEPQTAFAALQSFLAVRPSARVQKAIPRNSAVRPSRKRVAQVALAEAAGPRRFPLERPVPG